MYTNVFYFYKINDIGGIETFYQNLAEKYRDRDITIVYNVGAKEQIRKLAKKVRVLQWKEGMEITCKRAFFNFNLNIIDHVHAEEYFQIIHGDYKSMQIMPNRSPKIDTYLACSKVAAESFEELTGEKCKVVYNPAVWHPSSKPLRLISTTRLTREKGKQRIEKMAQLLDEAGVVYTWEIFTDDKHAINNPSIVYRKPVMDIWPYIAEADWLVQLSDNEGYCYSVVEALMEGIPVIVTPCPVFKELGLDDTNSITLDWDFEQLPIDKILNGKRILGKKKFPEYKPPKDGWSAMLGKNKSTYNRSEVALIQCIQLYQDLQLNRIVNRGERIEMKRDRAEYLADLGLVEILS